MRCFQCLATIVHFVNPAIWIANRAIDRLREYACDDMASAFGNGSQVESGEAFLGVMRFCRVDSTSLRNESRWSDWRV